MRGTAATVAYMRHLLSSIPCMAEPGANVGDANSKPTPSARSHHPKYFQMARWPLQVFVVQAQGALLLCNPSRPQPGSHGESQVRPRGERPARVRSGEGAHVLQSRAGDHRWSGGGSNRSGSCLCARLELFRLNRRECIRRLSGGDTGARHNAT